MRCSASSTKPVVSVVCSVGVAPLRGHRGLPARRARRLFRRSGGCLRRPRASLTSAQLCDITRRVGKAWSGPGKDRAGRLLFTARLYSRRHRRWCHAVSRPAPHCPGRPTGEPDMHRFTATACALALGAAGTIAASAGTAHASTCSHAHLLPPDSSCTPSVYYSAITQSTIHSTVCVSGWTATARPRPPTPTPQSPVPPATPSKQTGQPPCRSPASADPAKRQTTHTHTRSASQQAPNPQRSPHESQGPPATKCGPVAAPWE
jgi:hypothetical protein